MDPPESAAKLVPEARDEAPDQATPAERAAVAWHATLEELEAGLDDIRGSPKDEGRLASIVRRPQAGEREALEEGTLDLAEGLVGDNWKVRGSSKTPDGSAHPEKQLTLMNARAIALIAKERARWQLAGDQLFVDLDLSAENLPVGTQLSLGSAVIEVSEPPHTGCKKFLERFGLDATKFLSSPEGRRLKLRGINARVIQPGVVRVGDLAKKVQPSCSQDR